MKYNTSTITVTARAVTSGDSSENKKNTALKSTALALLIEEHFNKYGKKENGCDIDVEKYQELIQEQKNLIWKMENLLLDGAYHEY
jgi:hypothetical protein